MMDVGTIEGLVAAAKKLEAAADRLSNANTATIAGKSIEDKVQLDVEKELARKLLTHAEGFYRNKVEAAAQQQFQSLVR